MAGALTAAIAAAFAGGAAPVTTDEYFEYTTLLLPGNGTNGAQNNTFLDGSTNNFTITRNGNTTQGTFSPFSQTGWGNYFGSVSDYLNVTSTSLSSSFTIECFVFFNSAPSALNIIFSNAAGGGGNNWIGITSTTVSFSYSGTTRTFSFTPSGGTWYYVQIINSASSLSCYVNGSQIGTTQTGPSSYSIDRIGGYTGSGFSGYLSNVRVNSTALAVSATPTSPLTAVANTVLLTCQANRFVDSNTQTTPKTITLGGSPSVQAFSPFNPTASWSAATNGGSGYFDGNGDYLTAPTNAAFNLGTADFTIEWSFYYSETPPAGSGYDYLFGMGASATTGIALYIQGGVPKVWNGSLVLTSSQSVVGFTWYHLALVRSSGTLTMYLNGTSVGSVSFTSNLTGGELSSGPSIGAWSPVDLSYFPGYISNFRIVKGTAIVPPAGGPASPLTAVSGTSLLLNFTNAGIYDATSKNDLETVGNAQISTAQSKWGGSSMYFDGNEDGLIFKTTETLLFNTGDFTIECWVNFSSVGQSQLIVGDTDFLTGNGTWGLLFNSPLSKLRLVAINAVLIIDASWSPSTSTWYHIAVARNGSSVRAFINGTQLGSTVTSSANIDNTYGSGRTYVGRQSNDATAFGWMYGYLQDLRITKGYARYTANFTAPTAAFPTL